MKVTTHPVRRKGDRRQRDRRVLDSSNWPPEEERRKDGDRRKGDRRVRLS